MSPDWIYLTFAYLPLKPYGSINASRTLQGVAGIDLSQLASHLGGLRASLASPAEVDMLTGCVFGAIPPFSFHPNLKLVADPLLFERFDEIAFNAGLLEKSVIMNTQDYLRIARPELAIFRRLQSSPTA